MNCKPGDLAVIVRSPYYPSEVGRIVTVVEFYCNGPEGLYWVVKSTGRPFVGMSFFNLPSELATTADAWLRPIKPDDSEDEVLRITGKPQETPLQVIAAIRNDQQEPTPCA